MGNGKQFLFVVSGVMNIFLLTLIIIGIVDYVKLI